MAASADSLLVVCSYTDFDNLAHAPRGTISKHGLSTFSCSEDGNCSLLATKSDILNPAFARVDPLTDIMYVCTESIEEDGLIVAYKIDPSGKLPARSMQNARGTSTCYLTLDPNGRKLLFVNYWNSSLGSLPINDKGELHPVKGYIQPANVKSRDRADHLVNRQLEPHAHAVVLDPYQIHDQNQVCFVPDLGLDVIRQYRYNFNDGSYTLLNEIPSATGKGPHGPRYIEFHPKLEIAYVVNELSSIVSVFKYNREAVHKTLSESLTSCASLELVQQITTVPEGYTDYNTCGRVCVDPSAKFVLVSNRGHDSITTYQIDQETGLLKLCGTYSTQGETPRHFQLHPNGRLLCAANQDTDTIVMFNFDTNTGELTPTGQTYKVDSPNFVQFIRLSHDLQDEGSDSGGD